MRRLCGKGGLITLTLLVGGVGCHLTGALPVDLGEGHGRVDRTYSASLGNSVRATIEALDELGVHPKGLSVRAMEAVSDIGKPGWKAETNAEYFPDDQSFHDLFDKHQLSVAGAEPSPFNPVLVTYQGETPDGRAISVVVRAQPPDASQTMIMTRVGRDGDGVWGRKLLDQVGERLNLLPPPPAGTASADLPPLPAPR